MSPEPWPSFTESRSSGLAYQPLRMPGVSVAVVVGALRSTAHVIVCVGSTLPALSVEKKDSEWPPSVVGWIGVVYWVNAPPSSEYIVEASPDVASLGVS